MFKRLISFETSLVALFFTLAFLPACQKEYDPGIGSTPTPTPGGSGSFTAAINSTNWSATSKSATRQGGVIVLYGSSTDNKSIVLRVADSGVHVYTFHTQSSSNFGAYTDNAVGTNAFATNQWPVDGAYGTVNITAIDTVNKTMTGTFNMKVYRAFDSLQRTITQGVFTKISYSVTSPPPSTTDSFRVKVNGAPFTYSTITAFKGFGMISVSASTGAAPSVGITVPDNVTPGNYAFDIITYVGQYNPSSTTFLAADTGHVTILEHNLTTKRIRGTFQFKANQVFTHNPPDVQLTEGYFSAIYN